MPRTIPSPNQTSGLNAVAEDSPQNSDWLGGSDQMRHFIERLQPQQWLGPTNIAWVRKSLVEDYKININFI
jgi:hypothetical protein